MKRTLLWLPAVLVFFVGCGGGSRGPTTPSSPAASTPSPSAPSSIPAGTVITLVSGETDQPVAGASVTVTGVTQQTDGSGQVALSGSASLNAPFDIAAPGFLDRQTLLRAPTATRFTLWPRTSPTGLDESYTSTLVYTDVGGADVTPGAGALLRLRPALQPFVLPSAEIRSDPAALAAHQEAINAIAGATQGQLVYALVSERPASGAVFETSVDASDNECTGGTRAYTAFTPRNNEISSGRIVFCSADVARTSTVTHELGHTFGLQHSPDPRELMHAFFGRNRNASFSDREALTMRLMLQRRGGNRFPDNDREATVSAGRARTIICR